MSFLFPGFLFALFALSIPIIIHLFNFRRFKTIYFTNVKFLRNIQEETATRNRLKHLLVLISRLLALAFLIFAFAQPYIKSKIQTPQSSISTVGIYIDNSFSMEATDNGKQLLEIAKTKAEEVVAAYNIDDQFQLLTNDFEARHQRLVNKDEMLDLIRSVQISPTVKDLNDVTNRQKEILGTKDTKNNIYLISDFQKSAGEFEDDSLFNFTLVPLKGNEQRNLSIDSIWFTEPTQMLNQQSRLCFTVKNYGSEDIENASVQLKINNQTKGIADISVAAKSSITDTLQFTTTSSGNQQCELFITDYPITFDDVFYFSYQPLQKIPVLVINGSSENVFISSLYSNPLFYYQQYSASQIDFNNLSQFNLIIMNEVTSLSSGLSDALGKKIEEGATILILPSFDQDNTSINSFLSNNKAAVFGAISEQHRNVVSMNMNAEIFSGVYETLPKNLSLPYADRSFLIESNNRNLEEVILNCSDQKPLFAKYRSGNGEIYLSGVPLDKNISDLPVQGGIFAPIMFRLALMSMKDIPLYVTIGEEQWVKIPSGNLSSEQTFTVKNEQNEFIPSVRKNGSSTEIDVSNYAKQAGIYQVTGNAITQSLAMNYNRTESDLSFYSSNELKEKYAGDHISIIDKPDQNLSGIVTQLQQGKPLWKYCVIFALLFLAIEIAIIRFMP